MAEFRLGTWGFRVRDRGGVRVRNLEHTLSTHTQERNADFAVLVEIRIKSFTAIRDVMEDGRTLGVIGGKLGVEYKKTVLVGSPRRTNDHEAEQIHAVFERSTQSG